MQRCQHCLSEDLGSTGCPQHPNPIYWGWFQPPAALPQPLALTSTSARPPGDRDMPQFQCRPLQFQPLPVQPRLLRLCRPRIMPRVAHGGWQRWGRHATARPRGPAATRGQFHPYAPRHRITRGPRRHRAIGKSVNGPPCIQGYSPQYQYCFVIYSCTRESPVHSVIIILMKLTCPSRVRIFGFIHIQTLLGTVRGTCTRQA